MYQRILVAIENSSADQAILTHVTALAARYLLPPDPVHEEGALPAPAADRFAGLGGLLREAQ